MPLMALAARVVMLQSMAVAMMMASMVAIVRLRFSFRARSVSRAISFIGGSPHLSRWRHPAW